jgi:hypothetical protein
MASQFVEHYVFEYLEPVSKNEVGSYDLFDMLEVSRGKQQLKRFKISFEFRTQTGKESSIDWIDTNSEEEARFYEAGFSLFIEKS